MPGCCVRTGGDGSGRGPPGGVVGRGVYIGRAGIPAPPGRACIGGRAVAVPGCPGAAEAGRAAIGGGVLGAGRGTRRAGVVGSGRGGEVGRCSSMRSRIVGGTTRPALGLRAGGSGVAATAATGDSTGAADASASGAGSEPSAYTAGPAGSCATGSGALAISAGSMSTAASVSAATGAAGLTVLTRRGGGKAGATGLGGSAGFLDWAPFLPLTTGVSANTSPLGSETFR
ncbi:MAG: hypothetical protein A3H95_07840 [Acidobacteria bacterium RIFCSPLOWO2_02_FULL_64_15]|nr:MAG: hypothetical protein A3H95_07840 [Acidobacteria bacterium RIFCSPLOWO2_02_FULL_64_15]